MVTFGGDEVNALVVDVGSFETKVGYAGNDSPSYIFDSLQSHPHDLLKKAFALPRLDSRDHPLMLVDSYFSASARKAFVEYVFETLECPAFYLGNDAILTAFAAGKTSALVVSSGHQGTQVTPVYDGYILSKGVQRQSLAGQSISDHTLAILTKQRGISIVPQCKIQRKTPVVADQPSNYTPRDISSLSPELYRHSVLKTVHDVKETIAHTLESVYSEPLVATKPIKPYEFPDGFNTVFQKERYLIPEAIFNPKLLQTYEMTLPEKPFVPLAHLVQASLQSIDPDIRSLMYQNIVVSGGNTLFPGFLERLQYDMHFVAPGIRSKISSPGSTTERRYSGWVGGSILASLGTFHQLWISKQEYQELGVDVLDKR